MRHSSARSGGQQLRGAWGEHKYISPVACLNGVGAGGPLRSTQSPREYVSQAEAACTQGGSAVSGRGMRRIPWDDALALMMRSKSAAMRQVRDRLPQCEPHGLVSCG